ncbi:succinyl-diaminopimelate desuccinylase, partial [Reticulomyxa filosa]
MSGKLRVQLLKEGIHSGESGKVRDSFHVMRSLLDRFDEDTGECKVKELMSKIPSNHVKYAQEMGKVVGKDVWTTLPLYEHAQCQLPMTLENVHEILLNSTWRPQLCIVGCDGLPDLKGGNVLRQFTTLKLSVRLPPDIDPEHAFYTLKRLFESDPPFNAKVEFTKGIHTSF